MKLYNACNQETFFKRERNAILLANTNITSKIFGCVPASAFSMVSGATEHTSEP
jgi:hypothetical protein